MNAKLLFSWPNFARESRRKSKMGSNVLFSDAAFLFVLLFSFHIARGQPTKENSDDGTIPDEKWGYVTVRPSAHMFWWLYGGQNIATPRTSLPLIIWLQGGPGGSGTGFGNFKEIGPIDDKLQKRNTSWAQSANLLFIDNPVGTGFSYVDDVNALTTNISQIAEDLLTLMKSFVASLPVFENLPIYIFSESYGGKMTAAFGARLHDAIVSGEIKCRLGGVALGDSWISPVDSVATWGPYLYQYNLLDQKDLTKVMKVANETIKAVEAGEYLEATSLWANTEDVIDHVTDSVNVYNVLQHHAPSPMTLLTDEGQTPVGKLFAKHVQIYQLSSLSDFMNTYIRKKLGIIPPNVVWGGQSSLVFKYQSREFMKPVTKEVSKLLDAGVTVVVFQGQLDMICDTAGAELWLKKLTWSKMPMYFNANRMPLYLPGDKSKNTAAFLKQYQNLKMYYIMKAGHMVPADAGEMALEMVNQVINAKV